MDKRVTIRLDDELYKELQEWSNQSGLKVSDSVRYLIQEGLASMQA